MNTRFFTLLAVVALAFSSCSKNSSDRPSRFEIYLTDAPGDFDAVNIDIQSIQVNVSGDSAASPWQTLPLLKPGVYNLLDFRNGIDTILASVDMPAGKISQMRMVLGEHNSVVVDGTTYALTTPSSQQSGLKFNIHANLNADITYRLYIDFDAGRSVVSGGTTGEYLLKPVIRTYAEASGGAIKGVVLPVSARPSVWAVMGTDTLFTLPDSTGHYLLSGVPAGTWTLNFLAADTAYAAASLSNIAVSANSVTVTDTLQLQARQ